MANRIFFMNIEVELFQILPFQTGFQKKISISILQNILLDGKKIEVIIEISTPNNLKISENLFYIIQFYLVFPKLKFRRPMLSIYSLKALFFKMKFLMNKLKKISLMHLHDKENTHWREENFTRLAVKVLSEIYMYSIGK